VCHKCKSYLLCLEFAIIPNKPQSVLQASSFKEKIQAAGLFRLDAIPDKATKFRRNKNKKFVNN